MRDQSMCSNQANSVIFFLCSKVANNSSIAKLEHEHNLRLVKQAFLLSKVSFTLMPKINNKKTYRKTLQKHAALVILISLHKVWELVCC